ncbi:MAG: hypothetical protein OEZ58_00035 [Gammaproteobacteria bacterium]|nr:hypothetical protein [Gammaproteobacteria bacterium]
MIPLNTIDEHDVRTYLQSELDMHFVVHAKKSVCEVEVIIGDDSAYIRKVKERGLRTFRNVGSAILWIKESFAITRIEVDASEYNGAGLQWRETPRKKKQSELNLSAA